MSLPCLASLEYTTATFIFDDYKRCKIALFINEIMWAFYFMSIGNYISEITMIVLFVSTLVSLGNKKAKFYDFAKKRL
jgi:hypothetical protein